MPLVAWKAFILFLSSTRSIWGPTNVWRVFPSSRCWQYSALLGRAVGSGATGATMVLPLFVTMVLVYMYFAQRSLACILCHFCIVAGRVLFTVAREHVIRELHQNWTSYTVASFQHTLELTAQHSIFCVLRPWLLCLKYRGWRGIKYWVSYKYQRHSFIVPAPCSCVTLWLMQ